VLARHYRDNGNLIDAQHTNIEVALDFSKGATQIAPTYYVPGNHEASNSDYVILKDGLEAAGVVILEDEAIYLERKGETITLLWISRSQFHYQMGSVWRSPGNGQHKAKEYV